MIIQKKSKSQYQRLLRSQLIYMNKCGKVYYLHRKKPFIFLICEIYAEYFRVYAKEIEIK